MFQRRKWVPIGVLMLLGVASTVVGIHWLRRVATTSDTWPSTVPPSPAEEAELETRIQRLCGGCHVFPPPESLPKRAWHEAVQQGFQFAQEADQDLSSAPSFDEVLGYFERRAPEELPAPPMYQSPGPSPVLFRPHDLELPGGSPMPGVAHVRWGDLGPPFGRQAIVCDMRQGIVALVPLNAASRRPSIIAHVPHPCHAELVDLDQDGHMDLIVADLGTLFSSDETKGQVLWLRRDPASDRFETKVIASGLGRVADVQAADMDGDGDLDLVVAEFGGHKVGRVLYLENRTTDWNSPEFVPHTLDPRSGSIHVPIVDLNGDGRPDIVALISQEHEEIVALINEGNGEFRHETIYKAPDPNYGSTGIQVVDLDGDGDLDVLYTNGDSMQSLLVRPYHKVQWLENEGKFPFRYHEITVLPGVHRAIAADLDGDGDLDIVAAAFLPNTKYPERQPMQLDALIWLENRGNMQFVRHSLERITCDHAALELADVDGDGSVDLIVGNFSGDGLHGPPTLPPIRHWLTLWTNQRIDPRRGPDPQRSSSGATVPHFSLFDFTRRHRSFDSLAPSP